MPPSQNAAGALKCPRCGKSEVAIKIETWAPLKKGEPLPAFIKAAEVIYRDSTADVCQGSICKCLGCLLEATMAAFQGHEAPRPTEHWELRYKALRHLAEIVDAEVANLREEARDSAEAGDPETQTEAEVYIEGLQIGGGLIKTGDIIGCAAGPELRIVLEMLLESWTSPSRLRFWRDRASELLVKLATAAELEKPPRTVA